MLSSMLYPSLIVRYHSSLQNVAHYKTYVCSNLGNLETGTNAALRTESTLVPIFANHNSNFWSYHQEEAQSSVKIPNLREKKEKAPPQLISLDGHFLSKYYFFFFTPGAKTIESKRPRSFGGASMTQISSRS